MFGLSNLAGVYEMCFSSEEPLPSYLHYVSYPVRIGERPFSELTVDDEIYLNPYDTNSNHPDDVERRKEKSYARNTPRAKALSTYMQWLPRMAPYISREYYEKGVAEWQARNTADAEKERLQLHRHEFSVLHEALAVRETTSVRRVPSVFEELEATIQILGDRDDAINDAGEEQLSGMPLLKKADYVAIYIPGLTGQIYCKKSEVFEKVRAYYESARLRLRNLPHLLQLRSKKAHLQ
jgi:hypothetical protein